MDKKNGSLNSGPLLSKKVPVKVNIYYLISIHY